MDELITKPQTNLSTVNALGRGHEEETDQEDFEIPRAKIVQGTTEEASEGIPLGKIINSMTKEVLPEKFIPILRYANSYIQWNPRKKDDPNFDPAFDPGALIFTTTDPNDPRVIEGKKFGSNNELPKVTKYINFLAYFVGQSWPVVISFAKTSFAAGKRLNSLTRLAGGDMFQNQYLLKSAVKENSGTKYFVLEVSPAGKASTDDFVVAENLYEQFKNRNVAVHSPELEESPSTKKWDE